MAMSKSVGIGSIVIGCLLLLLTLISVICGGTAMGKMRTTVVDVTVGLWTLYFLMPGVISIVAGYKKMQSLLGVALGTHILGFILAIVGIFFAAAFWTVLSARCNSTHTTNRGFTIKDSDFCSCTLKDKTFVYAATCEDIGTVRSATSVITIAYVLLAIISLVGSIYGCVGTCCAPREPAVVIRAGHQPATVWMTTQANPAYNPQHPPPYAGQEQVVIK